MKTLGAILILAGLFIGANHYLPDLLLSNAMHTPYLLSALLIIAGLMLVIATRGARTAPQAVKESYGEPPSASIESTRVRSSRLKRSRRERVLLGICGGIGIHFNIDPVLVRVLWVLGTLLTDGFGLLVYLLLLLILPLEPEAQTSAPAK